MAHRDWRWRLCAHHSAAFWLGLQADYVAAPWAAVPGSILVIALLLGIFTRTVAALTAVAIVALAARIGAPAGPFVALHSLSAIALAAMGAGAYSIDARGFGRRVVLGDD